MNYKALEDLVNILVKKAGYNVNESKTMEDIDLLTKRIGSLSEAKDKLERKISSDNYINKDEKTKDLEEKKFLESAIDILNNQQDSGLLVESELDSLNEQVRLIELKIENKNYEDKTSKSIDSLNEDTLDSEIDSISAIINEKHDVPSELGLTLLEGFRTGKSFDEVKDVFNRLVALATEETTRTVDEISNANIFELMEKYSKEKDSINKKIQKDNYSDKEYRNSLDEKSKYHNKRITAYNKTLEAIDSRKKELRELVEESKALYNKTREERLAIEKSLEEYTGKLYRSIDLNAYADEFNRYLDYLKDEILGNKVLEDKYNNDVITYNDEIRTLELNAKNVNAKILEEENCLGVIESKYEALDNNKAGKINDQIDYLFSANRVENLSNEQQYFYVNVDTIKAEIINIWNKGNNSNSYDEYTVEETPSEEVVDNTMYETPSNDEVENIEVDNKENDELDVENTIEELTDNSEDNYEDNKAIEEALVTPVDDTFDYETIE